MITSLLIQRFSLQRFAFQRFAFQRSGLIGFGLFSSLFVGLFAGVATANHLSVPARVEQAMFDQHRSPANIARNPYRHPVGTLEFFGLKEGMSVMEIWPGSGWYTEVLAPVLRSHGQLIVAGYDVAVPDQPSYRYRLQKALEDKFSAHPEIYDQVRIQSYSPPQSASLGAADSLDLIVTFRSTHGWINEGLADSVYQEFARVLKPGGRLGVVQHRADAGTDSATTARQGYVSEATVIELAKRAGLVLTERSEVNANPNDDHNHPEGVWTLPPSLRLGDTERDKYQAIGESDRMTLLFEKPLN